MLWDVGNGTGKYARGGNESALTSKMLKAVKKEFPQAFVVKIHGGGYQSAGLPDVYIMIEGKSLWIEVKCPGGDTTALQKHTMELLKAAGAYVGLATSVEEFLDIVRQVLRNAQDD